MERFFTLRYLPRDERIMLHIESLFSPYLGVPVKGRGPTSIGEGHTTLNLTPPLFRLEQVIVIPLRLNANLKCSTVEDLIKRRKVPPHCPAESHCLGSQASMFILFLGQ
jgi:hypothetical protein